MYSKLWRSRFLGSENFHSGRTGREVRDGQLRKQNNSSLCLIFLCIMFQLWFVRVLSTIEVFISLGTEYGVGVGVEWRASEGSLQRKLVDVTSHLVHCHWASLRR